MSIINELRSEFSAAVRRRGEDYFLDGRVAIFATDQSLVRAFVTGTRKYLVELEWNDSRMVRMQCACPYSKDHGECKHIWATLLAAEREGLLDLIGVDDDPSDRSAPMMPINPYRFSGGAHSTTTKPTRPAEPLWKQTFKRLRQRMAHEQAPDVPAQWPADRQIVYILDMPATGHQGHIVIELATQKLQKNGTWGRPKRMQMPLEQWLAVPDARDQQIAQMLLGAEEPYYDLPQGRRFELGYHSCKPLLKLMCETGRLRLRLDPEEGDPAPLAWDDGPPWRFHVVIRPASGQRSLIAEAIFRKGSQQIPALRAHLVLSDGLLIADGIIATADLAGSFELLIELRDAQHLTLRRHEARDFLRALYALPRVPPIELDPELGIEQVQLAPKPRLMLRTPDPHSADRSLLAELVFEYGSWRVPHAHGEGARFDDEHNQVIARDTRAEHTFAARLAQLGFQRGYEYRTGRPQLALRPERLPEVVQILTAEGWHVEAEGKIYRTAGEFKLNISSGIDWFDVHGSMQFDEQSVSLPRLLEALRAGERTVVLDDGTVGVLPEQWLRKHAALVGLGEEEGDALRFTKAQIPLLDALLASMPAVSFDQAFDAARKQLVDFTGVAPAEAPHGFVGELRPYQKQGLGWLQFLARFSFGGCLADDMGLGKTIQVLALLEQRRATSAGPSLVVVPRSLVFNWKQEAARFTPQLRVLDHSGIDRRREADHFADFDLILTTYGTLRRDAVQFKDVEFDYVILDEAQAIKNASTASAKAARLLRGRHRLALSGTPIENHLGELWSVLEFLNPGMLGGASVFRDLTAPAANGSTEARTLLARALRPFILRRTKAQVADDLPEKTEQTILCELEPAQRKLYDELREHYRASLLKRIDDVGLGKSKMMVLEALLRLRQAACHPGLIDKQRITEPSAKFQTLTEQMTEVLDEGHKVLVFSQFTSLLAILRPQLDAAGISYEYLDGKTTDRQARVEHFQTDASCRVFLISLKAGGVGLNLTAADYVFLLDPWWNPAVEAQAIDRTHRIGQTRHVFAYRLIARDTVEEKVLELQRHKRDLADAIITADNSLIAKLGREDLELLLS